MLLGELGDLQHLPLEDLALAGIGAEHQDRDACGLELGLQGAGRPRHDAEVQPAFAQSVHQEGQVELGATQVEGVRGDHHPWRAGRSWRGQQRDAALEAVEESGDPVRGGAGRTWAADRDRQRLELVPPAVQAHGNCPDGDGRGVGHSDVAREAGEPGIRLRGWVLLVRRCPTGLRVPGT